MQAKLWLQHVIAGEPHFPDDSEVDQQLDREIHAAAGATGTLRADPASV